MEEIEDLSRELRDRGIAENDIQITLLFLRALTRWDAVVFSDKEFDWKISVSPSAKGYDATYDAIDDRYSIYAPKLGRAFEDNILQRVAFVPDEHGNVSYKMIPNPLTVEERVSILAIHEVRHRIQSKKPGMHLFSESSHSNDRIIKKIIRLVKSRFKITRDDMRQEGYDQAFIDERTCVLEFDSKVIEYCLLHHGITISDPDLARSILLIQPDYYK